MSSILKLAFSMVLIIGGLLIGGTVFAAKEADKWGDKLQDRLHN
ncbi:hypothetical protein ACRYI5_08470 [Furfurilactobacillus sp. WILCCON 0119]